jgi:hypothetical protein
VKHQLLAKSLCVFPDQIHHPQRGLPQATFGVPGFGSIIETVNTTTPISPVGSGTLLEMQFALRFAFSPRNAWQGSNIAEDAEVAMPDQDKAIGAWIANGIPGTLVRPNKNGRKWRWRTSRSGASLPSA